MLNSQKLLQNIVRVIPLLALTLVPIKSHADALTYAHEKGTHEALSVAISPILSDLRLFNLSVSGQKFFRIFNSDFDNSKTIRQRACRLANRWIFIKNKPRKSALTVYIPERIRPVHAKYIEGIRFSRNYPQQLSCNKFSRAELASFVQISLALKALNSQVDKVISKSKYNKSFNRTRVLSLQLKPIPLSLEVLNGSLRLKLDGSLGPFNASIQDGVSRNRLAKGGIHFLLLDIGEKRSIYYVRHLSLDLDILAGANLVLDGKIAKLTCSTQCVHFNSITMKS
ncbi:hypothetical protein [Alteromonas sp. S015]|uniref:hypothetical protein n=1 Tax=Alteromonas sp. S015 TaxID=3117401 RepID=UPI002FE2ADF8